MNKGNQAVMEDGEEVGGFQKNLRTKGERPSGERPWRHKTPRRPRDPLEDLSLAIIPEDSSPEEKEEKKMESKKVPVAEVARPQFEFCPLCGCNSKSVRTTENGDKIPYLVCKGCNDKYQAYVKKAIAQLVAGGKEKVLSKAQWILQNLDIGRFELELEAARSKRINPEKRLAELMHQLSEGQNLDPEGVAELKRQCQEKVGREVQEEYFMIRRLNNRLQAVLKFKGDLERIIAEAAKKAAEAVAANAAETALKKPETTALLIVVEPVAVH